MQEGDRVINFGEIGTKFYIIIKGNVSIYIPTSVEKGKYCIKILN